MFLPLFFMFSGGKWFLKKMKSYRINIKVFWDKLEQKYFLNYRYCPVCFNHVTLLESKILDYDKCLELGLNYFESGSYNRKSLIPSHYINEKAVYRNAKVEYTTTWYMDTFNCKTCLKDIQNIYKVTNRNYDDLYRKQ